MVNHPAAASRALFLLKVDCVQSKKGFVFYILCFGDCFLTPKESDCEAQGFWNPRNPDLWSFFNQRRLRVFKPRWWTPRICQFMHFCPCACVCSGTVELTNRFSNLENNFAQKRGQERVHGWPFKIWEQQSPPEKNDQAK